MLYKSRELFVVNLNKVIDVQKKGSLDNTKVKQGRKFYIAKLMKVGKNCCIYNILTKNILVVDNYKLVNRVGEYYITYKEAINLATGEFKREFYSSDEIKNIEEAINKEREYVK